MFKSAPSRSYPDQIKGATDFDGHFDFLPSLGHTFMRPAQYVCVAILSLGNKFTRPGTAAAVSMQIFNLCLFFQNRQVLISPLPVVLH